MDISDKKRKLINKLSRKAGADISQLALTPEEVSKAALSNTFNIHTLAPYYELLAEDMSVPGDITAACKNVAERVRVCGGIWFFNIYRINGFADLHNVQLCHNRFCPYCQKILQVARLMKFYDVLDKLAEKYDIYHLALTVPNVPAAELNRAVDTMYRSYARLHRFLKSDARIRGIDFAQYGYAGGIRGFECTFQTQTDDYHPHFHAMILLKKGLKMQGESINDFSYDNQNPDKLRSFSDLEILIQKIWYLLNTGCDKTILKRDIDLNEKLDEKTKNDLKCKIDRLGNNINLDLIDIIPQGYSCMLELRNSKYYEVFKYVTKIVDKHKRIMTYPNFRALYRATYHRRVLQTYGELYRLIPDPDRVAQEEFIDKWWAERLKPIQAREIPTLSSLTVDELARELNNDRMFYGSCNKLFRDFEQLRFSEKHNAAEIYKDIFDDVSGQDVDFYSGVYDKVNPALVLYLNEQAAAGVKLSSAAVRYLQLYGENLNVDELRYFFGNPDNQSETLSKLRGEFIKSGVEYPEPQGPRLNPADQNKIDLSGVPREYREPVKRRGRKKK